MFWKKSKEWLNWKKIRNARVIDKVCIFLYNIFVFSQVNLLDMGGGGYTLQIIYVTTWEYHILSEYKMSDIELKN